MKALSQLAAGAIVLVGASIFLYASRDGDPDDVPWLTVHKPDDILRKPCAEVSK